MRLYLHRPIIIYLGDHAQAKGILTGLTETLAFLSGPNGRREIISRDAIIAWGWAT